MGGEEKEESTRETRTVQINGGWEEGKRRVERVWDARPKGAWVGESKWRVVGGQVGAVHPALLIYAGGDAGASRPARIIACQDVVITLIKPIMHGPSR